MYFASFSVFSSSLLPWLCVVIVIGLLFSRLYQRKKRKKNPLDYCRQSNDFYLDYQQLLQQQIQVQTGISQYQLGMAWDAQWQQPQQPLDRHMLALQAAQLRNMTQIMTSTTPFIKQDPQGIKDFKSLLDMIEKDEEKE